MICKKIDKNELNEIYSFSKHRNIKIKRFLRDTEGLKAFVERVFKYLV